MAIYRGTGGSVEGISEADILVVTVAQGGTGAQTAAAARTNLGLGTAATTAATDYATAAQGTKADTALQPSTIGVSVQAYNANTVVDSSYVHTDNNYTTTEKTKLSGIAEGAEVNVNADWNASSGDAQILNKPSLATVATSGSYTDLSNTPTIPTNLDSLTDVVISSASTDQILKFNGTNWVNSSAAGGGSGTVTSVAMSVPTGLAVSGSPITSSGTLALTYDTGYAIPTTAKQTEWDTAYTDRNKWDGGSTGLNAATGRTSLGLGTAATLNSSAVAQTANNLSDLTSAATARTNLGLVAIASSGSASDLSTGTVGTARLGSGTASSSTYLRGDQTWSSITLDFYAVDVLVVAGGGAGGSYYYAGGGGAGGYIASSLALTSGVDYSVVIGAGGAGTNGSSYLGNSGANSIFNGLIAIGGGGGGSYSGTTACGASGGSGGGASGYNAAYPNNNASDGLITRGFQGNGGGIGGSYGGGGGGGASARGSHGTGNAGGNGGSGLTWFNGTTYAGGGGGGAYGTTGGSGGSGGGGAGASASPAAAAANGTANTGGGGGGVYSTGSPTSGSGGSGIVIIRYYGSQRGSGGTVTSSGGFTYHTFTTSGTFTA